MAFKESTGFCEYCNKQVLTRKEVPSKTLFFLATIFTAGFAIIFWVIANIRSGYKKYRCSSCGQLIDGKRRADSFVQVQPSKSYTPLQIMLGIGFAVIAISIVFSAASRNAMVNDKVEIKGATPSSTITAQTQTPSTNSPAYKAGQQKGFQEGKSWAKKNWEVPMPIAIKGMAVNRADDAKTENKLAYQAGFESGFNKGFTSIKKITRRDGNYEPLSWSNAKAGVKLYNYWEEHEVTIVGSDRPAGLITVRYIKDGTVEDKSLDSLSRFWFARKKS